MRAKSHPHQRLPTSCLRSQGTNKPNRADYKEKRTKNPKPKGTHSPTGEENLRTKNHQEIPNVK